jgi:hypothetical protein
MSKAVTQDEVEDVLSSIRRLVSEDKRPLAGLRDPAAVAAHDDALHDDGSAGDAVTAPEAVERFSDDYARAEQDQQVQTAADAPADRFVLTPSLRVVDDAPKGEEPLDLGSVPRETWTAEAPVEEATVEDAKAYEGPMVLFPAAQDSVPQEDRDAAMEALDALVHETIESDDAQEPAQAQPAGTFDEFDDGDYSDEFYWRDADDNAEPDYDLTGAIEEDVSRDAQDAEVETSPVPDQPIQSGDDVIENMPAEEQNVLTDDSSADAEDVSHEAPEAADAEPEPEAADASIMPLTAKIAALEAAVGKIAEGWEPDGDEAVELAATQMSTMAWEDDVELDAKGAPFTGGEPAAPSQEAPHYDEFARDEVNEADKPSLAAAFGGDDQLMDEETLRELVSEIVRAELQGALGERITRNVRKLVRREIHRALTAHEME